MINLPDYGKYTWKRLSPGILHRNIGSSPDRVVFESIDLKPEGSALIKKSVQVELQVATSPFTDFNTLGLEKPTGLVYSYLDTAPDLTEYSDGIDYFTPFFHGIEYKEFAPTQEVLDKLGGIYYYVRGIFYIPDETDPSLLHPYRSETLTIAYRATSVVKNEVKTIEVKSGIPFVQFLKYQPIKWQDPHYDEYFEVTRHIEASEMNFSIKNSDTGQFLMPFAIHCQFFKWTTEQYQATLDAMLPVGAEFHYIKSQPGFWDEFFSLLKQIYTGVQNAYASAKNSVVGLIDYLPLLGENVKGYLKTAVKGVIDYGLITIGLPPSLPNLDLLAEGGLDYCLKYAVDQALAQAGVPADSAAAQEITERVREELAHDITGAIRDSLLAQHQNPFRATFLRLTTTKLYEPAYVEIKVANYSAKPSSSGSLGASFGTLSKIYNASGVLLPVLLPGESMVVRLYLEHQRDSSVGYNNYFDQLYNGKTGEAFIMNIKTGFYPPDVIQAAKDQGIPRAPLPYVTEYVYDHSNYNYSLDMIPANPITEMDGSVNPADFAN